LLILAILAASPAAAAVVRLKDGTVLKGTVVSATALDVMLQTDSGTQSIAADRIQSIEYGAPAPAAPAEPEEAYQPRRHYRERASFGDLDDSFSLNFGIATPVSRVTPDGTGGTSVSNGDAGGDFGFRYFHALDPRWELGLSVDFSGRDGADRDGLVPFARTNVFGRTFMPLLLAKYTLTPRSSFARPYFLGGAGPDHTSTTIDSRPLFGFAWADTNTDETRRLVDGSNWGWAEKAAFGMDFGTSPMSYAGFEVGWIGIQNPDHKGTQAGQSVGLTRVTGKLSEVLFTVHWGWRY
jgi:hypothetical protein